MPKKTGISHEELRRVNTSALLTWVHHHGPTTRARLTSELGLNRSTIGDLTSLLAETGLVEELRPDQVDPEGVQVRRSGRPSLVVSPRTDVGVLTLMLDVDRIVAGLVGLGGELFERIRLIALEIFTESIRDPLRRFFQSWTRRIVAAPGNQGAHGLLGLGTRGAARRQCRDMCRERQLFHMLLWP